MFINLVKVKMSKIKPVMLHNPEPLHIVYTLTYGVGDGHMEKTTY